MPSLSITEIEKIDPNLPVAAPEMPALAEQVIKLTGQPTTSDPFGDKTRYLMLCADNGCALAWGYAPTATVGVHRLPPNVTRFYAVTPGQRLSAVMSP